jgi:hypothetical protein
MNISGTRENGGRPLSTADLAAAARRPSRQPDFVADDDHESALEQEVRPVPHEDRLPVTERRIDQGGAALANEPVSERSTTSSAAPSATSRESLVALFTPELTETYRSRWISIQTSFVDDPRQAVRNGDELVAQIMTELANSFAQERHLVETQLDETGEGSTENLRIALRRYRSFFERLLSL